MSTYQQLDEDMLREFMTTLSIDEPNDRQFVVHAGAEFHRQVEIKMEKMICEVICEDLLKAGIICSEIHTNLLNMVNSDDTENLQVAKSYIKNIQHVDNI